jgi:hypothetical protein
MRQDINQNGTVAPIRRRWRVFLWRLNTVIFVLGIAWAAKGEIFGPTMPWYAAWILITLGFLTMIPLAFPTRR